MDFRTLKSRFFHYLGWCGVFVFTWYSVRYWAEVREFGFRGVHAVKAVCATFLSVIGWFDVLVMAKRRKESG